MTHLPSPVLSDSPAPCAVIMAGGRGERFWPLSRAARPKQFVDLFGGKPLIRHAADRLDGLVPPDRLFVVTSRDLVPATREALPDLPPEQIVGEPVGRDTAAACALATELVARRAGSPDTPMAILTADQLMGDLPIFRRTLADAFRLVAERPVIATIGITPTYPATGFGYIESGDPLPFPGETTFVHVARFVEKPDAATAARYLAGGRHFWNAGMFLWTPRTFRDALRRHRPALADGFDALAPVLGTPAFDAALERLYNGLERISVDYAVMEKADNIVMARGEFVWDDVGSLAALPGHFPADADGNVALGRTALLESARNIVVSHGGDGHLVAVFGANDLVVVHTPDATLVCPRERAADLKRLVRTIGESGATDTL